MLTQKLYYQLKPFIPRSVQIALRRMVVQRKRKLYAHIWPIDEKAAKPPAGWKGWPDGKRFALLITHDVETAKGQDKCRILASMDERLGFRSSFNFVAKEYNISSELRHYLVNHGFEVGVHGLYHDENLFSSKKKFQDQAFEINHYLEEWGSVGFRTPCMYHNLEWIRDLDIEYDSSTFDTDPFEPQPDGVGTIFPFWVPLNPQHPTLNTELKDSRLNTQHLTLNTGYIELPYTLPQDHALFIIMREKNIDIWKKKLDWLAHNGGMALLITHPDYMNFDGKKLGTEEYPVRYYEEFLEYIQSYYKGQYWHVLPRTMAKYWSTSTAEKRIFVTKGKNCLTDHGSKKIWIDLDNSPHVPFFRPIIEELEKRGYPVLITARNRFQVCELADRFHMKYKRIGRYYGKNKIVKLFWTTLRALQLSRTINEGKPKLALSHGSRSQILLTKALGIPSIVIFDYEHAKMIPFFGPTWLMAPEIIASDKFMEGINRIIKYPGIKEDVYVPNFRPNPLVMDELKLDSEKITVTIRPPATEAHYFNPESEKLFESALDFLCEQQNIQVVLLPRSEKQKAFVGKRWASSIADGRIIIPKHAVDGLNLIWYSDLVISGGGTMNREAAALGVPVYSIFRGKIGAVDRYLAEKGRLILIENKDQIYSKIALIRRDKSYRAVSTNKLALQEIVSHIVNIIEGQYS